MNKIVKKVLSEHLDTNGKIIVPENFTKVKIDVGLSINAPHPELWLSSDKSGDLCVFGFEPNTYSIEFIKKGVEKNIHPIHLDPSRINKTFFIFNTALSDGNPRYAEFYCTEGDPGTSSLFKPRWDTYRHVVHDNINVPVITLKHFFDVFPWDRIPYIEQLKTDTQGSDFEVIKGCGDYLSEKVVYLDVEPTTKDEYDKECDPQAFHEYVLGCGFECIAYSGNVSYYNKRYSNILDSINYQFLDS